MREERFDLSAKILVSGALFSQKSSAFARFSFEDRVIQMSDALPSVGIHVSLSATATVYARVPTVVALSSPQSDTSPGTASMAGYSNFRYARMSAKS